MTLTAPTSVETRSSPGTPTARSANPSASKSPTVSAQPKRSFIAAVSSTPGESWLQSWLLPEPNPVAVPYSTWTTPAPRVLVRAAHRQVGVAVSVEVTGGEAEAEPVAGLAVAEDARAALAPELVVERREAVGGRAVDHVDHARVREPADVLVRHADRQVADAVSVEVAVRKSTRRPGTRGEGWRSCTSKRRPRTRPQQQWCDDESWWGPSCAGPLGGVHERYDSWLVAARTTRVKILRGGPVSRLAPLAPQSTSGCRPSEVEARAARSELARNHRPRRPAPPLVEVRVARSARASKPSTPDVRPVADFVIIAVPVGQLRHRLGDEPFVPVQDLQERADLVQSDSPVADAAVRADPPMSGAGAAASPP